MPVAFEPLTGRIGALVTGVDFSSPDWERRLPDIRAGLLEHLVLVFKTQTITAAQHVRLGELLGELEPRHPLYPIAENLENLMVIENGPERPPDNEIWHADMTFRPEPPHCSLLQAKVLPPRGGDTMFADMHGVYEALSPEMRTFLGGLRAIHDVRYGFRDGLKENNETDRLVALDRMPVADSRTSHPVVAAHPLTGRPYVNVNEVFTECIEGVPAAESDAILGMIFDLVRQPRLQVRHRWSIDDLVIWDNLATQHYAVGDYAEYRRMQRVTVKRFRDEQPRRIAV